MVACLHSAGTIGRPQVPKDGRFLLHPRSICPQRLQPKTTHAPRAAPPAASLARTAWPVPPDLIVFASSLPPPDLKCCNDRLNPPNICPSATANGLPSAVSRLLWDRPEIRTTMPSPNRSLGSTRPRLSADADLGATSKRWSLLRSNGSTGSTTGGFSNRSATYHLRNLSKSIIVVTSLKP